LNKTDVCCDKCRRDKKRCEGGTLVPCRRCNRKRVRCTRTPPGDQVSPPQRESVQTAPAQVEEHLDPNVVDEFGPTANFVELGDGYYVIFNSPRGDTFLFKLDGRGETVRRRELRNRFELAMIMDNVNFEVDELLAPGPPVHWYLQDSPQALSLSGFEGP